MCGAISSKTSGTDGAIPGDTSILGNHCGNAALALRFDIKTRQHFSFEYSPLGDHLGFVGSGDRGLFSRVLDLLVIEHSEIQRVCMMVGTWLPVHTRVRHHHILFVQQPRQTCHKMLSLFLYRYSSFQALRYLGMINPSDLLSGNEQSNESHPFRTIAPLCL